MKAIIFAGGRSVRMGKFIGKLHNKIFLPIKGKAIIFNIVTALTDNDVKEICFIVTSSQIRTDLKKMFEKNRLFSDIKFSYLTINYSESPYSSLTIPEVKAFQNNDDIFLIHGDTYFTPKLITKMKQQIRKNILLIGVIGKIKKHHLCMYYLDHTKKTIVKVKKRILKSHPGAINIENPYLFSDSAFSLLREHISSRGSLSFYNLSKLLLSKGKIAVITEKTFNINTLEEYNKIIKLK